MRPELYGREYFEDGVGSNYVNYGDDPGWGPTADVVAEAVDQTGWMLTKMVYEVGAAKGWFMKACADRGLRVKGIDLSQWAVDNPAPGMAGLLEEGNALSLPWRARTGDGVCSWELLEHIPEESIDDVLWEMYRVLKPGGLMFHRIALLGSDQHEHDKDVTHVLMVDEEWWRSLFDVLGVKRRKDLEDKLNDLFRDRDWYGRFFVYQKHD